MIPEGWTPTELGTLADFTSGGTPSKQNDDFWGGTFPWVSAKDLKKHVIDSAELGLTDAGKGEANTAPVGAVLILVRGMTLLKDVPIGYVAKPVAFNQDIKALIAKGHVDPKFLAYLLVSLKRPLMSLVNTANHGTGRLDTSLLKAFPVILPPIEEQRRIAKRLETWDHAIETVEALIANARAQKHALMQQLLPQGTTPPKKRLPGFSGEWREAEFNEVFDLKIGGTPARKNPAYWDRGKATQNRWVAISDLQSKYIEETQEHISDDGVQNSNVKALPAGTVIFSFKLSIGRKAILRKSAYTNEAICALIPKNPKELGSLFVFHVLELIDFMASTDQAVKGATLNKAKIADLYLSFPPREEQERLVEVLEDSDSEIAKLQAQLTALRQEKAALMQQLLTGKRRVKLVREEKAC